MSNLQKVLKELYNGEIKESELELASKNLINFFKILQKVQSRQENQIPNKSNEEIYENNGSSN